MAIVTTISDLGAGSERRFLIEPGTVIGDYRVDGVLGEGGMATVYAATHTLIGKRAAIKVISGVMSADPVAVERFLGEARAVNAIRHPNIVDVFSFGELLDGRSYFVMELLEGETLYDLLGRRSLAVDEALQILAQVGEALTATHDKAIVHRDIKPENIFVCEPRAGHRTVKLLDFGVAKLLDGDEPLRRTRTGCIVGTPAYMSPEQIRQNVIDGRADVYSLGVVAYEMFCGDVPFDASNPWDIVNQHLTVAPKPPRARAPEVPEPIERLIMRMLTKDVTQRPTMVDVGLALAELRKAPPPTTIAPSLPAFEPARPRARMPRLALVAVATLLALGAYSYARSRRPPATPVAAPASAMMAEAAPPQPRTIPEVASDAASPPPAVHEQVTRPAPPASRSRVRKVGRKHGRDYVVDPFGS